jgi:hypothetical protein
MFSRHFNARPFTAVITGVLFAWGCVCMALPAAAADKAAVQQGINRGAANLRSRLADFKGADKTLAYLALFKAGEAPDGPIMREAVAHIMESFQGGAYKERAEHIYEAAIEITLLADLDAEKYLPQIQLIADYLIGQQKPYGTWTYPSSKGDGSPNGDMSITHYACLGLWAAERAGAKVDPQVWQRALEKIGSSSNPDGGFSYWPGTNIGEGDGQSMMNMTVNSVGTILIGIMNLEPKRMPKFDGSSIVQVAGAKPKVEAQPKKPEGALEAVNLDDAEEKAKLVTKGRVPDRAFGAMQGAYRWIIPRFDTVNKNSGSKAYYYYSLERMASLANIQKIGDRDWFNECADYLLAEQKADGSWAMSTQFGSGNDTSFCVLFLTRSTAKVIKRRTEEPPVGGGLLSGGRGLPDDLKEVDANGNVKKKKEKTSLDDLLASLADPDKLDLEDTQTELVQQIQLGDKKELIGKTDKLLALAQHPNPDIRRTAIWAIGRTGDLSLARFAILGLDDPDRGVMTESHLALCWTARKPRAFQLALDPLAELPADASEDQKSAAVETWRRQALRLWGEWYLRNRPYEDRGDEFETNLRNRLLQLN